MDLYNLITLLVVVSLFYITALINVYFILGLNEAAKPNMILCNIRLKSESILGTYLSKPFLSCYKCMSSLWAGLPMWVYMLASTGLFIQSTLIAFIYTCVVCGLSIKIHTKKRKYLNEGSYFGLKGQLLEQELTFGINTETKY